MKQIHTAALCGVAALCGAGIAIAASDYGKVMKVDLPDGSIAQVEYHGTVAPKVRIASATPLEPLAVVAPLAALPPDGFVTDLDRQVKAKIEQANMLQHALLASHGQPNVATFGSMPAGTVSYQSVWSSNGSGLHTQLAGNVSGPQSAPQSHRNDLGRLRGAWSAGA